MFGQQNVTDVSFRQLSLDDRMLASTCDGALRRWDIETGTPTDIPAPKPDRWSAPSLNNLQLTSLSYAPRTPSLIVSGTAENKDKSLKPIHICYTHDKDGKPRQRYLGNPDTIKPTHTKTCTTIAPDNATLALSYGEYVVLNQLYFGSQSTTKPVKYFSTQNSPKSHVAHHAF
ncbi:unnamed protein product [marine sediment metagenome]|uniref:Uncharacterized protein n=1 Tax=marine sediment metagenome TaxID=412755 RepID=X1BGN5_9ZZZZ